MPPGVYPSTNYAEAYSVVLHHLKAAAAMRPAQAEASGRAAVERMKLLPPAIAGPGRVREDGRKIHPVHLIEAKGPAEVKGEWDLYRLTGTIEVEQAMRPLNEGGCPLARG